MSSYPKPIKYQKIHPLATLERATPGSAGYDLSAAISSTLYIQSGDRILVPTGIKLDMGINDIEAQVRSRSGLTLNKGLVVANGIGTIDSDYTGEIGVIIHNISRTIQLIEPGDKIAQLVFVNLPWTRLESTLEIKEKTTRGSRGFGSTDIKQTGN